MLSVATKRALPRLAVSCRLQSTASADLSHSTSTVMLSPSAETAIQSHGGGIVGAVAFVGLLVGANFLAIWCEVNNPNASYLQDLGQLHRRTHQSTSAFDDMDGKALVEYDEVVSQQPTYPLLHPRYEKRLATKLIHVQLKGWSL